MNVIEKFTSINGEGLRQGELAIFLRFAGCNLRCPYCDTVYSYIDAKWTEESVDSLVNYCIKQNVKNVTLTGGEPLLQNDIKELITKLSKNGFNVEIETNGSINIKEFLGIDNVSFTLDYKCPTSLMEDKMDLTNYDYITKKDSVKFVVGSSEDLNRFKEVITKYDLINKTNVLVSPVYGAINLEDIVNFMINNNLNGVKYCLQIHKIIWDPNKRGV